MIRLSVFLYDPMPRAAGITDGVVFMPALVMNVRYLGCDARDKALFTWLVDFISYGFQQICGSFILASNILIQHENLF